MTGEARIPGPAQTAAETGTEGETKGETTNAAAPSPPRPRLKAEARAALARKYGQLLRWRLARDASVGGEAPETLGADRPPGEPATRPAMRALAAEFPGCLRELDLLGAPELARRAALLALADPEAPEERWVTWIWTYHHMLAAALAARRGPQPPISVAPAPATHAEPVAPPSLAASLATFLDACRTPAAGKLSRVTIAFIARQSSVTATAVSAALFPSRRR